MVSKSHIIGHLGKDPELTTFDNGREIATLSVAAVSRRWRDKDSGERKEKTNWHRVVVNAEHAVKFAKEHLKKGDRVYVEGLLEQREFKDKDTNKMRSITEIIVTPFDGALTGLPVEGQGGGREAVPTGEAADYQEIPY